MKNLKEKKITDSKAKKDLFKFSKENLKKAKEIMLKYPEDRQSAALLPLLDIAQRQNDNYISNEVVIYISEFLKVSPIKVYEVVSFYTMFNTNPVGKNFIQVCRTTPCWLRGSDKIVSACKKKLGIEFGEVTKDGKFSLIEVECLGACVNAPVVQINDDYYEDLDQKTMEQIIDDLKSGKTIKKGSQTGRQCSAPVVLEDNKKKKSESIKSTKEKKK